MKVYTVFFRWLHLDATRFGGLQLWLLFRALPAVVTAGMTLLLLWTSSVRAEDSVAQNEMDLNSVSAGQLLFQIKGSDQYSPALLHGSKVKIDISGMIATVAVEQTFRNDSEQVLEGVYAFPLPETAAVRYMEMHVGERRIVGKIRERAEARRQYEAAKTAGRKASLVEQQRPNLFTTSLANIAAGEVITVRLKYVQQVEYRGGEFALRLPTTITPRYISGTPLVATEESDVLQGPTLNAALGWAQATDQVPDATAITPWQLPQPGDDADPLNPLEISVRLDMGMPLANVEAPYHDIALSRRAGVYDISLAAGVAEMDRDFVLNWQPVRNALPTAALFTERVADEHYGLLMVMPPAIERTQVDIARDIIFVIDTSGSMGGVAIAQARASLLHALDKLHPQDRFNIIEFNSYHRALYTEPMFATRSHLRQARRFVRQLHANAGTEMLPALRAALDQPRAPDRAPPEDHARLRQVIFITDGAIGNELALFEEIHSLIGETRLFTVGIGSAPNSWFMREASRFGRGSHTHIASLDEVEKKMNRLFAQLSQPVALDVVVEWPMPVETWPQRLPDLYHAQPLMVAVKYGKHMPQGIVTIGASLDGKPWRQSIVLTSSADPEHGEGHKGVATLWARQKITGLMDMKVRGASESEVRAQVLPVALSHQLLSAYTSFVAIEERVTVPPGGPDATLPVANTRPAGQSPQTYAYPQTATTGPAKLWLGLLLLFAATLVRTLRQPEIDHKPRAQD
ncbi:MAG: marine proteobacterial sortase target protein [Pseudomonadota bacterium]